MTIVMMTMTMTTMVTTTVMKRATMTVMMMTTGMVRRPLDKLTTTGTHYASHTALFHPAPGRPPASNFR